MANNIMSLLLLLSFGGAALWQGANYTPVMGTCLEYDMLWSHIANRGLFAYEQVQNGQVTQYQNWGVRIGAGLKVGTQYKLLVSKNDPNKIVGYSMYVYEIISSCVLALFLVISLVIGCL